MGERDFTLESNFFEGTWTFRADFLRAAPLETHPLYCDHPVYMQTLDAGLLATTDLGDFANYIYRWHFNGNQHVSAYPFQNESDQTTNIEKYRAGSTDIRTSGVLIPADLNPKWRTFVTAIEGKVAPRNHDEIRRRLSSAPSVGGDDARLVMAHLDPPRGQNIEPTDIELNPLRVFDRFRRSSSDRT